MAGRLFLSIAVCTFLASDVSARTPNQTPDGLIVELHPVVRRVFRMRSSDANVQEPTVDLATSQLKVTVVVKNPSPKDISVRTLNNPRLSPLHRVLRNWGWAVFEAPHAV